MKTIISGRTPWFVVTLVLAMSHAPTHGQLAVLASFNGTNGASPSGPLVQAKDGNLYGVTSSGGTNLFGPGGFGTVFKVSTGGAFSSVASFTFSLAGGFLAGFSPLGGLVQGQDGNLYGMAQAGGVNQLGALFTASTTGSITPLFSFNGTNGAYPQGGLVQDAQGKLYGCTQFGGAGYSAGNPSHGTVFKVDTNGAIVWSATFYGTNGDSPVGITIASDGNLYGTTANGGQSDNGTIFRVTPDGTLTMLYSFSGAADGGSPQAGLVQGRDGSLYGTAEFEGPHSEGVVFRITTTGVYSVAYAFGQVSSSTSGQFLDGANPTAALVQGTDGNFYGTTASGGTNGFGTVFSLSPQGALTPIYSFGAIQDASKHPLDGSNPSAALRQASDGLFYGTTPSGGANDVSTGGDGTIFRFGSGGNAPFIAQQPTNQFALIGGSAALTVVAGGTAPLGYQWQFNNANLADNARISGSRSNVLTITGILGADFGPYQVIVTNVYGSVTSTVATLTQAVPPGITLQPTNVTVNPGSSAFLVVGAYGTPPLSYQWIRNGTNLIDGGNIFGSSDFQLEVSSVSTADAGTYSVVVSSPFGQTNSAQVTIALANVPDLIVSNIVVPPQAWTGGSFDVSWAESNQGQARATGPWVDYLYLSPDNQTQDAAQFLGQFLFTGNLDPGQTTSRIRTVTLNLTGITNGQYHVLVVVNALGTVFEGPASANNLGVSSNLLVKVTPLPALKVTSVTAPTNGLGAQTVAVRWAVCNDGQADTDVPIWYDHLYLSKTNDLTGVVADYGTFENPSYLAVGDCYEQDVNVVLPVGISGPFYFVVNSDSTGLLGVDNGSNVVGSSSSPIDVQFVAPGFLHVASVQVAPAPPTTVWAGDLVTVIWTIQNIGQASITGTWFDAVTLSRTTNYDFVNGYWGVIEHVFFTGPLDPGQSYTHTNQFLVPTGIATGTWYVVPIVDNRYQAGGTGSFESGNIGRDQNSTPIIVAPPIPSDLEVSRFSAPANAYAGQTINVRWVVSNNGLNGTSSDNWVDTIFLSTNGVFDTNVNLRLASFVHWGALDIGASYTNEQPVTIFSSVLPANAQRATNYLFAYTDLGNQVIELTKTNNMLEAASPLIVVPAPPPNPPYLTVASVSAPSTLLAGGQASVIWAVTNRGGAMLAGTNWTDALYLSSSPLYVPGQGYLLGQNPNNASLGAGETYSISQSYTVPGCLSGTYYLTAVADVSNIVDAACCETNNFLTLSTPIQVLPSPYPSLQVTALAVPATLTSAVPWTAQWSVTNAGTAVAAGTWFDAVYASASPVLDSSAVLLGQFQHNGGLSVGAKYSQSQSVQIPPCSSGNDYIFVIADVSNSVNVATTCQRNNPARSVTTVPVSFGAYPDLMVSAISIPASASANLPMSVSWTVTNAGSAMATGSWIDSVYLGNNSVSLANSVLLGSSVETTPLPPGGTYTQTVPFSLPNVNGSYYVFVVADATNRIQECRSQPNNMTVSSTAVNIQPTLYPDLKVTSVQVPPTAYAGQPITVSWVVSNEGTSSAGPAVWNDAVYLSQDQVLNFSATRLGTATNLYSLGTGQSYTNSATVIIPTDKSGPFYVLVLADSGNVLFQHLGYNDSLGWNANAMQITLPPPTKLQPANVSISPASGSAGTQATITWTVSNQTTNPTASTWTDAIYLSTNNVWDLNALLLADVNHTNLGALASYTGSWTGPLPGLSPGSYYAIVRADVRDSVPETSLANLTAVSASPIAIDVPVLVLGQQVSNQLNTGGTQFYKVNCPAGQTVRFTLTGSSPNSANELYVRFGAVPDLGNYDFVYSNPMSPNQQIDVPTTQAGWYYVMVRGENEPGGPLGYTLTASIVPFAISSVRSDHIGDNGQVTITVTGAKFQNGATVQLVSGANSYSAETSFFVDATTVKARFFFTNAVHATYDVVLTNPGNQSATATQAVTIEAAVPLSAKVIPGLVNSSPRVGLPFVWLGEIANDGNVDIPYLTVVILDLPNFPISVTPPLEAINSQNNEAFLVRDVPPATALDFSFVVSGFQDQSFYYDIVPTVETKAQFLAKVANDAESLREFLSDPSNGLTTTVTNPSGVVVTNPYSLPPLAANALATTNGWEIFFAESLVAGNVIDTNDLSSLPTPSIAPLPAVLGKRIRPKAGCEICETAETAQETIHDVAYAAEVLTCATECIPAGFTGVGAVFCYVACMTIPVIHHIMEVVVTKVTRIYCEVVCFFLGPPEPFKPVNPLRPKDPNEKQGPNGYSSVGFVGSQVPWQYTIYFENTSNAPAFARQVSISDALDPNLDLRTFRVGNVVIGGTTITVPTNNTHFQTRISLPPPNPTNVVADISVGVNVQNRSLSWTMNAIDLNTGQLVTDTQQGVLPPNTTNNVGAGYVTFSIKPSAGLRTGTLITNQASIVFDTNDPLPTNPTTNTVDAVPPTSAVAALPAAVNNDNFTVSWAGKDDTGGSGVAGYNIWFSDNGGPYQLWLADTNATSAQFNGEFGHAYAFFSTAQDNAGNVEAAHSTPDATTSVTSLPVLIPVGDQTINVGAALTISNVVSDANVPSPAFTYSLGPNAPVGATISTNGVFFWAPDCLQGSTTNLIEVLVTASGSPPQTNSILFKVLVGECVQVGVGSTAIQVGQSACVPINLISTVGLTNLSFTLDYPANRFTNWSIAANNPAIGTSTAQVVDASHIKFTVGARPGQVLQGPTLAGEICFNAASGSSAFVPLEIGSVSGMKSDGTSVGNISGVPGQVAVVSAAPLLEAGLSANQLRLLTIHGNPGTTYVIEWKTNLLQASWTAGWSVTLTNLSETFTGVGTEGATVFYRAK